MKPSLLILFLSLLGSIQCLIDWDHFNHQVETWVKDFHNHLQSVKCLDLNLNFKAQGGRHNRINKFEFERIQLDLFENLIVPFDKNPVQKVFRIRLEKVSFLLELFGYPEIVLRFKKVWVKMLFNVQNEMPSTQVDKIKITFEKLEWDDEAMTDMKGDTDKSTFEKMKVGIKELEPGFAKAFSVVFKNNYQRMYEFLENKEYENYNFGEFLTLIFKNYDPKKKILNIDAEWLRNLVEEKEKMEKEITDKLGKENLIKDEKKKVVKEGEEIQNKKEKNKEDL